MYFMALYVMHGFMCVTAQKGVTGLPEGLCSGEGKVGDGFFSSLEFPDGIRCTLGVCPTTMIQ